MPRRKSSRNTSQSGEFEGPRIRPQEQLLIDVAAELPAGRLLCNTAGRGQFARAYMAAHPEASADCWFLDVFQRDQARDAAESPPGIEYLCTPDPPEGPYDVVAWAFGFRGETELKREMLQAGYLRLAMGGRYVISTDDADDQWFHTELKKLFDKVTRRPFKQGVLYLATKTNELAKQKSYDCEFAFRDRERLLYAYSRPSVFSHRRIDPGARTLINVMEIQPGQRILDLGCGAGTVGMAALARAEDVSVLAVDCNPRAIESITRGAAKNELTGLTTSLDALGTTVPEAEFDLVLANPPYFSNYRIASLFLEIARRALKPRGQVVVVTKTPHWFEEHMPEYFPRMNLTPVKEYVVATAEHRPRR
ncbi:methyltransferase [bacterium]|nr:methyltransferase [bacterium]